MRIWSEYPPSLTLSPYEIAANSRNEVSDITIYLYVYKRKHYVCLKCVIVHIAVLLYNTAIITYEFYY